MIKSGQVSLLDLIRIEHLIAEATGLNANALPRRSLDGEFARRIANDMMLDHDDVGLIQSKIIVIQATDFACLIFDRMLVSADLGKAQPRGPRFT